MNKRKTTHWSILRLAVLESIVIINGNLLRGILKNWGKMIETDFKKQHRGDNKQFPLQLLPFLARIY